MTPRQRVQAALDHQEPDRVPTALGGGPYGVVDELYFKLLNLPGLGDMRWDKLIAALYSVEYNGVVSIEHEDRAFEKTEELVIRGFQLSRDVLKPFIH